MDKNKNGVPDKIEGYSVIVVGFIIIITGIVALFTGVMPVTGVLSCFGLGSALIGGEEVKKYLENKKG